MAHNIFQKLKQRRLVNQLTHQSLLTDPMPNTKAVYVGFDPTAESIHLGNLVSFTALQWFRTQGYRPIVLFGGATGLIGDPSGKSTERNLMHPDDVRHNVIRFQAQFSKIDQHMTRVISATSLPPITYVNNYDFYSGMSMLDFMRDVGKHFRVNTMLSRDSVKSRLTSTDDAAEGISFTEFSYQILQAYDFYQLYKQHDCALQIGGSDQWGNIASGTEFVRRKAGERSQVYGMTIPLLVDKDGNKFGKSTGGGALWLDADKTSPYSLYQYLLNVQDTEVEDLLYRMTFHETIQETMDEHSQALEKRIAQKKLASSLVEMVHGPDALQKVIQSTEAFFKRPISEVVKLSKSEFLENFGDTKVIEIAQDAKLTVSGLVQQSGLRKTRADGKRVIEQRGLQINGVTVEEDLPASSIQLLHSEYLVLQAGKKGFALVKLTQ